MSRKLFLAVLLIIIVLLAVFILGLLAYNNSLGDNPNIITTSLWLGNRSNNSEPTENITPLSSLAIGSIEKMFSRIITPNPLNQLAGGGAVGLTRQLTTAGIVANTNEERLRENLPPLTESTKLNQVARARLDDMFKNQYFAHASPAGGGVAEVAQTVGYSYIVVGENLALGQFKDDEAVVSAWMASTGHKANILARRYLDIGVAAGEGVYKGQRARMAVQIFGTPIDLCPIPSDEIKKEIYANKARIDKLEPQLAKLKNEFNTTTSPWSAGAKKINEYNKLVVEFNNLIKATQAAISQYNVSVAVFNNCAQDK
ncbi:MAG: hypothetical protein A2571_03670 [Candidatus Vogelbacteria bacterium RIFOXYD1_FULL_44_32]|uniref:SCP domain-containing protein n=1 Tax=Candidatus Vogelbacteria bacterium RIFOXYD1_FULL_44_32 TaxID=1802438 RepID=A0A1G2QC21_9BACT|nr:MAG: hypothetical protein A2571_03670 [Candidatus Vogelbacteria bacterium RIFOXYD1_FULL_44_32]